MLPFRQVPDAARALLDALKQHFIECLTTGEPFAIDVESSLRVDEIMGEVAAQLEIRL